MANNRRNQSGAVRFVPAMKALLLCTLVGGSAVGYVLQKKKILELGQQLGARQEKLERLRRENQFLAKRQAVMLGHPHIMERVKEMKLNLVTPQRQQIVWISEPAPSAVPVVTSNVPSQFVQLNRQP